VTTLAAYHLPERGTWVGSDGMISAGGLKLGPVSKWVLGDNGWAAGSAGQYAVLVSMQAARDFLFRNLEHPLQFAERLREVLAKNGFEAHSEGPGPSQWGEMTIVLASPFGIWEFCSDLSIHAVPPGIVWGAGSGRDFAFAAGRALIESEPDPERLVRRTLDIAIELDIYSGMDVSVFHLAPIARGKPASRTPRPRARKSSRVSVAK
jgi:hypothetical protein